MFLIYSLLFTLGVIIAAPYYLWRLRGRVFSAAAWRERFGFLPTQVSNPDGPGSIWIHAVSVGETLAIVSLVERLRKLYPERRIFLSHVTPAGRDVSEAKSPGVAGRFFLPLDWSWCVRRVVERVRPSLLLIVETELWPNLLRTAHSRGARVVIVNARLSERSFRGYQRFRPFIRRVLANVDWVGAQTAQDAERFRALGAPPERVAVAGNLKFESRPPRSSELNSRLGEALKESDRGPVVIAASTMPDEEPLVLRAWASVLDRHPRAMLILAPRHPARFDPVAQLLARGGRKYVRRSELNLSSPLLAEQFASAEILLLDTLGELAALFEIADVAFVGGSLVPTGGHNLLEPAFWGKPVLFGPHMNNFQDVAALFKDARAGIEVPDSDGLARELLCLLEDPALRERTGTAARQIVQSQTGALERTLAAVRTRLEASALSGAGAAGGGRR